jgi:hypothetical protein
VVLGVLFYNGCSFCTPTCKFLGDAWIRKHRLKRFGGMVTSLKWEVMFSNKHRPPQFTLFVDKKILHFGKTKMLLPCPCDVSPLTWVVTSLLPPCDTEKSESSVQMCHLIHAV